MGKRHVPSITGDNCVSCGQFFMVSPGVRDKTHCAACHKERIQEGNLSKLRERWLGARHKVKLRPDAPPRSDPGQVDAFRRDIRKHYIAYFMHIAKRDGEWCAKCCATVNLAIDHIQPLIFGGTNDYDNLQILCRECNSAKGQHTYDYRGRFTSPYYWVPPDELANTEIKLYPDGTPYWVPQKTDPPATSES